MKNLKSKPIFKILLYVLIFIIAYICMYMLGYVFDSYNGHIFIENCTGYSQYFFLPILGTIGFGFIMVISYIMFHIMMLFFN